MNNTSNPNPSQAPGESQPKGTPNNQCSQQSGHCVLEPLRSAMNEGTQRAKAAAEKAVPRIKAAVSGATYWLGFGVSFATVFSYIVVRELAPEALKAGWRDGANAGERTADNLASKLRTPSGASGAAPSAANASSGSPTEPAAA